MALESFLQPIVEFVSQLSLYEAWVVLQPLILFILGMVVYAIFVFKFYRFIASKDIFHISGRHANSAWRRLLYYLEYIFLFPIIAFFWFFVLSVLLAMLSDVLAIQNILMASMAMLATIRVTAYYKEDLSKDIAKLVPFGLLAVFLLDITGFTFSAALDVVYLLPGALNVLVYQFIFIVVLEFVLRIVTYRKRDEKDYKKMQRPRTFGGPGNFPEQY